MKRKELPLLRSTSLVALGVFLGHGALASTVLDFENQVTNTRIAPPFGDNAMASSEGVTVVGFGTPNVGLVWQATGAGDAAWEYYNDSVWTAAQLNDSAVGVTHTLGFVPNSASGRVVLESFNFHPYYESNERFTYALSVLAGASVVSGPTNITFLSDATKNHPVSINYTGAPGQTVTLQLERIASTLSGSDVEGDPYDIAVDDITFAQLPETVLPVGPQIVSVTPANGQTGVAATYYPFLASITNRDTTLVTNSIHLMLDAAAVSPPPDVLETGGVIQVRYVPTNLLTSGSVHTYALSYDDSAGSSYTNEVRFTVANYATLPTSYANSPGSGVTRGFTYRTVAAPQDTTNVLDSSVARAKAQLSGTLIDPSTSLPYTNSATPGTNSDGSFNMDTVLNFSDNATDAGNFPEDQQFPALDAGPYDWFSSEALLYLDLPAGYYRLGVNSDDGFEFNAIPPQGLPGSPIQLGIFDNGRGADDTVFDFLVQTSGVYGFQLIYFESTGDASEELFSVNLSTGDQLLVNDAANPNAIKSYRALVLRPQITSVVRSGTNLVIDWVNGTPPFQVQSSPELVAPTWTGVGSPTTNRTATVPIQGASAFIRVFGE